MAANAMRLVVAVVIVVAFAASADPRAGAATTTITGGVITYTVAERDTLRSLSARFGVDVTTIAAENGLKVDALAVGQRLQIDNRHIVPAGVEPGGIIVNVPQRMLFFGDGDRTAGLPVAVGQAGWKTPTRPFTVSTREIDPTWEVPASIQEEARRAGKYLPPVVPPGPKNPLGRYWLGLSIPSVGIHSTNAPSSIYRATTHGCIRVGPDDMAWLFPRVATGAVGSIVYEPILLAAVDHDVFLEVHPDIYRRVGDPTGYVRGLIAASGVEGEVDPTAVDRVLAQRQGVARVVGLRKNPSSTTDFSH